MPNCIKKTLHLAWVTSWFDTNKDWGWWTYCPWNSCRPWNRLSACRGRFPSGRSSCLALGLCSASGLSCSTPCWFRKSLQSSSSVWILSLCIGQEMGLSLRSFSSPESGFPYFRNRNQGHVCSKLTVKVDKEHSLLLLFLSIY